MSARPRQQNESTPPPQLLAYRPADWRHHRCAKCASVPGLEPACGFWTARIRWEWSNRRRLLRFDVGVRTPLPDEPWHLITEGIDR
jgi:hypothetical protein